MHCTAFHGVGETEDRINNRILSSSNCYRGSLDPRREVDIIYLSESTRSSLLLISFANQ